MLKYILPIALSALPIHAQNQTNSTDSSNSTAPTCGIPGGWDYKNASGELTIPGFQPPDWDPRNWTVHFGIKDIRNTTSGKNQDYPFIWIDSPAEDDKELLDSPDLPYRGCEVSLLYDYRKTSTGSIDVGGDGCKNVYSDKCFHALQKRARDAAIAQSKVTNGTMTDAASLGRQCMDMVTFDDDACEDEDMWSGMGVSPIFGTGSSGSNGTDHCPSDGVTGGSIIRLSTAFLSQGTDAIDNFTTYDNLVHSPAPVMLIAFNGNDRDGYGWGSASLVCPTINSFEANARIPPRKEDQGEEGAAMRLGGLGLGWVGAVVGMVVVLMG